EAGARMISNLRREKIMKKLSPFHCLALGIGIALLSSGCATPIGVTRVDPRTAQYKLTDNALNTDRPSSFSSQQLLNRDLYEMFDENPKEALAKLHKGLEPTGDEDRVFALAELSFLHAENSGDRSYYLAAAASAYALRRPGTYATPTSAIDPRARWQVTISNRTLDRCFTSNDGDHVVLKGGQFA